MDEFIYHNLFDTKGIEYLVVIGFLLLLIPFWLALNKPINKMKEGIGAMATLTAGIFRIPQGVYYSRNHLWAYLEKSGIARLGFDDFLMHITGDVSVRFLKKIGDAVKKGDPIAEIEKQGKTLRVFSPVTGKLTGLNNEFIRLNGSFKSDPYGKGWLCAIKPAHWLTETRSFHFADEAVNWFRKELDRYRDFVALTVSRYHTDTSFAVLQDGGELTDDSLSLLPEDTWHKFQDEFLRV